MEKITSRLVFANCTETDLNLLRYMCHLFTNTERGKVVLSDEPEFHTNILFNCSLLKKVSTIQSVYNKCISISFVRLSHALSFLSFLAESEAKIVNNNDLALFTKDFFLLDSPLVFQFLSGDLLGILYYNNILITTEQAMKLIHDSQTYDIESFIQLIQIGNSNLLTAISYFLDLRYFQAQHLSVLFFG